MTEYKQLNYDMYEAFDMGVNEHPQLQMKKLGYNVIGSVPQSLYDSWWFTVEEFIEPLEPYLTKNEYNYDYWHGKCHIDCEFFKADPTCCYGGFSCKKH